TMSILLYRGFAGSLSAADSAAGAEAALLVAQSRLAALGIEAPLQAGEAEGNEGDMLWHVTVRPYAADSEDIAPAAAHLPAAASAPRAFWATVAVVWRERRGRERRSLQLTTLKLELPK